MTFTERLRRRRSIWWASPGGWRNPSTWDRPLHRLRDRYVLRDRTWPDERWRCCDLWQRSLLNKWNSREFAILHGVPVPALYWHGRRIADLPLDRLPDHFVLRPTWGAAGRGTHVMSCGRDPLHERSYTIPELRAALRRECGLITLGSILAVEFMTDEQGDYRQGIEYSFYTFGERVAAIESVEFQGMKPRVGWYREDWTPFQDRINPMYELADPLPRPSRIDELLDMARRLGAAFDAFVRVDMYLTATGCFFGEFSSTPYGGTGFTPWADEYLGRQWAETFPDRA